MKSRFQRLDTCIEPPRIVARTESETDKGASTGCVRATIDPFYIMCFVSFCRKARAPTRYQTVVFRLGKWALMWIYCDPPQTAFVYIQKLCLSLYCVVSREKFRWERCGRSFPSLICSYQYVDRGSPNVYCSYRDCSFGANTIVHI